MEIWKRTDCGNTQQAKLKHAINTEKGYKHREGHIDRDNGQKGRERDEPNICNEAPTAKGESPAERVKGEDKDEKLGRERERERHTAVLLGQKTNRVHQVFRRFTVFMSAGQTWNINTIPDRFIETETDPPEGCNKRQ